MNVLDEQPVLVQLSADELRYLAACGPALIQEIPANSLPTYSCFDKSQITEFTERIRRIMDEGSLEPVKQSFSVQLRPDELRYMVSCGFALSANVSAKSFPMYCHFDADQALDFSIRIRRLMDEHGLDM